MIRNEMRYREKILNYDEKHKISSNISLDVFLLYSVFAFSIISIMSVVVMFVFSFIEPKVASLSIGVFVGSFIVSVILVLLLEREVISKELNDKLYIYFNLLMEFLEEDKSKIKIRMVNRKLRKYLNALNNNINNVFIFKSTELEPTVVKDIRRLINEDFVDLLKHGKRDLLIKLVSNIKETYLCAEGLVLIQNPNNEYNHEFNTRMEKLKNSIKQCRDEKQNILNQITPIKFSGVLNKFVNYATKQNVQIVFFTLIGVGSIFYINRAGDYSKIPANISVVGFFLMIIIFIIQSNKRE